MKILCKECGCHFPEEFEFTLKPECHLWDTYGLSAVSVFDKKILWDHMFGLDCDYFANTYALDIRFFMDVQPYQDANKFEKQVLVWKDMDDAQRRDYERQYFKLKVAHRELARLEDKKKSLEQARIYLIVAKWYSHNAFYMLLHRKPSEVKVFEKEIYVGSKKGITK
jgi:hypothetical protein